MESLENKVEARHLRLAYAREKKKKEEENLTLEQNGKKGQR